MALDFPASPTVGQLFPSPPTAGLPVWKWDGTTWNVYTNQGSAAFSQYEFTATAGQTTFTGADINGNTLAYALGYVMVFINGDRLNKADYTASNGTSIVFAVGRAVGDQVTVEALTVASIINALLTTNNLSDLASKPTARTNLGAVGAVKVQTFIVSGTYTPDPNLLYAVIECLGGGGSGGSCVAISGQFACGSGGGGGAYARKTVSKATIGASQTVTIGAGGAAPAAGANNGNTGGTTSVGSLCSAAGGNGGGFCQISVSVSPGAGGGTTGTGDLVVLGGSGGGASITQAMSVGWGGSSHLGGTVNVTFNAGTAGATASGCGGAGAFDTSGTTNRPGGAGGSGAVIITEYCSQ